MRGFDCAYFPQTFDDNPATGVTRQGVAVPLTSLVNKPPQRETRLLLRWAKARKIANKVETLREAKATP